MLFIGAMAGWLVSRIFMNRGLGLFGNVIVGLLGSVVGYWVLGELGIKIGTMVISTILTGVSGAIVILLIMNLLFYGRKHNPPQF